MPRVTTTCSMGSSNVRAENAAYNALWTERALLIATTIASTMSPKVAVFSSAASASFAFIQNIVSTIQSSSKKNGFGLNCVETKIKKHMTVKEYKEWTRRLEKYSTRLKELKHHLHDRDIQKLLKKKDKVFHNDQNTIWDRISDAIIEMRDDAGM